MGGDINFELTSVTYDGCKNVGEYSFMSITDMWTFALREQRKEKRKMN